MPIIKVTPRLLKLIKHKVGSLFDTVKARFLGKTTNQSLIITHDKTLSLPGIYEAGSREEGGIPDTKTLDSLVEGSDNFLESLKLRSVNQIIKDVEQHLAEEQKPTPESIEKVLQDSWKGVTKNLSDIIDSETQTAKNISLLNGIIRTNAAMRVEDPVIAFITPIDGSICDECLRLHVMPDRITPRLWYLSELKRTWGKRGDSVPSYILQHPHCRAVPTTILPGWGFNESGRITYIGKGHSEIEKQRR